MERYVVSVLPVEDFRLEVTFDTGERRMFDVSPYLTRGVFQQLRDPAAFESAHVVAGSVEWRGTTALSSPALSFETLYAEGMPVDSDRRVAS